MEARARIPVGPPIAKPLPSYWQDPKSPLANVVEAEADKGTTLYDYAIIGSGISGTMTAYYLLESQPSARIVLLEARESCSGATGRNGGHTKAASYRTYLQHVKELGKEEALKIARLEYANIIETHRLAKELGFECESQICNTVDLIYDRDTFEQGKKAIEALRADAEEHEKEEGKMAWYKVYEKENLSAVKEKFWANDTNTNPEVHSSEPLVGAFEYLAGRIHAYRFTTSILKNCVQKGLQLCTSTPVHRILPTLNPETKETTPEWEVFTQFSTIKAKHVILATNGYTPYILSSLQGAIVPLRGQITVQKPGKATKLVKLLPTTYSFIYKNGYEYMIPRPLSDNKQHIVIGGGLGRLPNAGTTEYGTVDDGCLNPQTSKYLRGSLIGYFGAENWGESTEDAEEAENRIVQEWTGIMGATADGRPFVGEVPENKGMWVSAGFNGHGMVLCLKSAEALVGMITGGGEEVLGWFPGSFLIGEERVRKSRFQGRVDMKAKEGD